MNLVSILKPNCVKVPLVGKDKDAVIEELVDVLNDSGQLLDRDVVLDAVISREMTRSTGIGSGIAIPHGKCKGVSELVMAIGIAPGEIEFDSIDGKGVNIIVLLASPIDRTGPHIQALARISRIMLDEDLRTQIAQGESAEKVYQLISDKENE